MKNGIVGFLVGVLLCVLLFWMFPHKRQGEAVADTLRVRITDTIRVLQPVARDSVVVRYVTERLPVVVRDTVACEVGKDSAEVEIPIVQKRYTDSTYTAWVSGYRPSLDSIHVYRQQEIVTIKEKQRRWNVGISAGYGLTPKGLQPYVGLGVSYRLW